MRSLFIAVVGFLLSMGAAAAQEAADDTESGLAVPRMVSLRSNLINARSGPGARYPIEWVYMQKGAPVEIIAEFELWRKIKDWQGSESWVHKSMLSGRRTVKVITPGENNLYEKADYKSQVIAKVEDEVVGEVLKCPADIDFCRVRFDSVEGWLPKSAMFGVYAKEVLD